jgi:hypothetical protein
MYLTYLKKDIWLNIPPTLGAINHIFNAKCLNFDG